MKQEGAPQEAVPREAVPRAVVIHGASQVELALRAGSAARVRLLLLSAPGAAEFLGPGWWLALMAAFAARIEALGATERLDCGASAGRAMEALRLGARDLVLARSCPQFDAVEARAAALSARLSHERPDALDLAAPGAARQLEAWLRGDPAPRPHAASGAGRGRGTPPS